MDRLVGRRKIERKDVRLYVLPDRPWWLPKQLTGRHQVVLTSAFDTGRERLARRWGRNRALMLCADLAMWSNVKEGLGESYMAGQPQ